MAYGKGPRSFRRKRSSSFRKKASRLVPRKKKTNRMYTRNQGMALMKLSRDVKYLKVARHGEVQKNLSILNRPLQPTALQPCFCVINNLQVTDGAIQGCPWYQLNAAGASTIAAQFIRNDATFYEDMNSDIVDTGSFFLSKLELVFRIVCVADNNIQISNKRVRIDIFKQRSRALKSPDALGDIQQLPAVGAQTKLRNMAIPTSNRFSSEYFQLLSSKFVYLNPSKVNGTDKGTGAAIKYVSMSVPYKHLGKFTQQLTDPATPNDPTVDEGYGVSNFPISQRIWCMVSSDLSNTIPSPGQPDITVQVSKFSCFRDSIGSASL